jgi:hypothetical protein
MKQAALLLMFAALLGGAAQAASPLIDRWDAASLTTTLHAAGARNVRDGTVGAQPGLLAETPDGLSFGLYAKACVPTASLGAAACHGLEAIAGFDPGASADRGLLVDKLNHDYAAGKFMVERDGSIRLVRYLNLEGDVTEANLRAELSDFFAVAAGAKQTLWAAPAR